MVTDEERRIVAARLRQVKPFEDDEDSSAKTLIGFKAW